MSCSAFISFSSISSRSSFSDAMIGKDKKGDPSHYADVSEYLLKENMID